MKLLVPKSLTSYIDRDQTLRQALEKMRYHGYTALPVLNSLGEYVGTVSEGDFLRSMTDRGDHSMRAQEELHVADIMREDRFPPLGIESGMAQIVLDLLERNFAPVVDDRGKFVGIVTRRDVLKYLSEEYFRVNPEV
jgi:CBS domain-containing protein